MKKAKKPIENTMLLIVGAMFGFAAATFFTTINTNSTIVWIVAMATFTMAISLFIDFIIQPGQIFAIYGRFLESWVKHERNPLKVLYKPMGGCLYCMNIWVALAVFIVTKTSISISWWWFIPMAALSHVFLAIMERKVNA
jgi:hypothetical protein